MTARSLHAFSRRAVLGGLSSLALPATLKAQTRPAPQRIVSLGGAVTEILYALGAGDRIVALDTTSLYPPEALKEKPNVGYLRQLSAEGILSSSPELVLAADGAGPPDALALVRQAGVPVTLVADPPSEAGVLAKIMAVGRAAGLPEQAARLAAAVQARFDALAAARATIRTPLRAMLVLSLQNGRVMVGGRNSSADAMLTLAGAENAGSGAEGYKPFSDEAIVAAAPAAVVLMRNGPDSGPPPAVFENAAFRQTPAAARNAAIAMDGLTLLGFGPRTPDAALDLLHALYPDLPRAP